MAADTQPSKEMSENMADPSFPPVLGSTFIAKARYVESPHNFYVIPLAQMKHLPALETPGALKKLPMPSDMVVFKSSIFKKFMRGEIRLLETNKAQCTIYTVDYGYIEEGIKLKDIFELNYDKSKEHPPLAIHCELFMCVPRDADTFDDEVKEAFQLYLGHNENLQIKIKGYMDNKFKVELRNSNSDDASTMLALTGYTCYGKIYNVGAVLKYKRDVTWLHREFKEGETLSVRIQYASSFSKIYVCTIDDYKDYLTKRLDFMNYCRQAKRIEEHQFVVGKAVGVNDELYQSYERAVITEIIVPKMFAKVRLIDWGKESIVHIARVKLIQTEVFADAPVRAIYCSAINSEDFKEFMPQSLCAGYNYRITIVKRGFEFKTPHAVTLS